MFKNVMMTPFSIIDRSTLMTSTDPNKRKSSSIFISVVLSFFNEEGVLPELIRRLRAVMNTEMKKKTVEGYEMIFVNDASKDNSLEILLNEAKQNDIVIVNMSRNFGVSECTLAGIHHASNKADAIVFMDADLQDPPEVIPELIQKFLADEEVEVVYTTRTHREGEDPFKMFITKVGYRLINAITSVELPVDSGDFKLISRRVRHELSRLKEKNPYLRGLVSWVGFKQVQVFYVREERFDGRENTKFPLFSKRTILRGWFDQALISFSDIPLKLSLIIGFAVSAVSLLYLIVIIAQKILGYYTPGWPSIMFAILFLGGIQLTLNGLVGLYINTIYLESKDRPNYIVKNVVYPVSQLNDPGDS